MIFDGYYLRNLWRIIIILATTYIGIWTPLHISMDVHITGWVFGLNGLVSFIFLLDILWHLYQASRPHDQLFHAYPDMPTYLRKWLLVDLLPIIPFEFFWPDSYFQLFHLVKLVRVGWYMYMIRENELKATYWTTLFLFCYWVLLSCHWLACGWIIIRGEDAALDSMSNYILALYWSVTTLTTVGYGDVVPETNPEIIYTMVVLILGVGLYGYVIGNIASILSKVEPARAQYLENIDQLHALLSYRKIPNSLQRKIRNYYTYRWQKRLGYDEATFLEGLPVHLQTEVALHLKKEVVDKIPLFNDTSDKLIREIALELQPMILTPGDYLFKAGDIGSEMFFVITGELEVLSPDGDQIYSVMKEGDFFGEIALFKNRSRTASIRAINYCELYFLDKPSFGKIMAKDPQIAKQIKAKIKARAGS